jgi:putative inorganic carbon (HCO3(-)) transporter
VSVKSLTNLKLTESQIIFWLLIAFVSLPPIIFNPWGFNLFDLPKTTFLKIWTLVACFIFFSLVTGNQSWRSIKTPLSLPLITFMLFLILTSVLAINPFLPLIGSSFDLNETIFIWLSYFLIFIASLRLEKGGVHRLLQIVGLIAAVLSVYALFQQGGVDFSWLKEWLPQERRSIATLGNPLYLGAFLTLTLPVVIAFFAIEKDSRVTGLLLLVLVLIEAALIFTFSRGSWLASVLAVVVFLILASLKGLNKQKLLIFLTTLLLLIALISVFPVGREVISRGTSLLEVEEIGAGRLSIWRSTLRLIAARPLVGWGIETMRDIFPIYEEPVLSRIEGEKSVDRPHNQLLYLAYATGSIGLLTYLWFCLTFFALCLRKLLLKSQPKMGGESLESANDQELTTNWLLLGIFSATLGYFIQEQFSMSSAAVTPLFWSFIGFALILSGDLVIKEKKIKIKTNVKYLLIILAGLVTIFLVAINIRLLVGDIKFATGLAWQKQGRSALALSSYQEAVSFNPWDIRYRYVLGEAAKELSLQTGNVGFLKEAIDNYYQGMRYNPRGYLLYLGIGHVYHAAFLLKNSRESDQLAKWAYNKAHDLRPYFADPFLGLGVCYLDEGEYQKAISYFKKVISLRPDVSAIQFLAEAYEKLGNRKKALMYYQQVLSIDPDNEQAELAIKRLRKEKRFPKLK